MKLREAMDKIPFSIEPSSWEILEKEYGDYELVAPEQPKPEPEALVRCGGESLAKSIVNYVNDAIADAIKHERERLVRALRKVNAHYFGIAPDAYKGESGILAVELERGEG